MYVCMYVWRNFSVLTVNWSYILIKFKLVFFYFDFPCDDSELVSSVPHFFFKNDPGVLNSDPSTC